VLSGTYNQNSVKFVLHGSIQVLLLYYIGSDIFLLACYVS